MLKLTWNPLIRKHLGRYPARSCGFQCVHAGTCLWTRWQSSKSRSVPGGQPTPWGISTYDTERNCNLEIREATKDKIEWNRSISGWAPNGVQALFRFWVKLPNNLLQGYSRTLSAHTFLKRTRRPEPGRKTFWTFRKFVQICHEMAQKWPKMTQNVQSDPNMTQNGPAWP